MINNTHGQVNHQPVIGILTIPLSRWVSDNINKPTRRAKSYLPVSYIRWVENSGARVVPIQYTATTPIIKSYLSQINGVIICGDLSLVNYESINKKTKIDIEAVRYAKAAFTIFQWAKKENNNGSYFPLLGIGMGYEELMFMALMPKYYTKLINSNSSINFSKEEIPNDELVKAANKFTLTKFKLTDTPGIFGSSLLEKDKKLFSTNLVCCMMPGFALNARGKKIRKIEKIIEINSVTKNEKLKTNYINAYSFKDYPFYGMAFHNLDAHCKKKMIEGSNIQLDFSNKMSELFVSQCRKNLNKLYSKSILIYNYTLYSPNNILKILYPENWQTIQLRPSFTNSYFFGLIKHVRHTEKDENRKKEKK